MSVPQRKLGRYELLRRLAIGGMGEIYLARTRGAGGFEKQVIIKTILPHLAAEDEFVTKFLDEGRIVVQLTHGNIVPVFDMGEEDGEYFIAMEYVPGLDVRAILKRLSARDEQLPVELALYIGCEVCKGLGYAHRKVGSDGEALSIVHRDVSPSNVLVSQEGEVKIIDFGIARATNKLSQTASGAIQGKCCYMSPEQARGQPLDARSDIFSAGVLLYEMLTLTRPFEGRSDLESLELVRVCDVDPPGILRPEISEEIDAIVTKAMAPDPDDRYQIIDDLYVDLQHELYRLGHTVTSHHLAGCLQDVFEDDSAEEPFAGKPANLDEALELELSRMAGDHTPSHASNSSLGHARTAAPGGNTRTIAPTPTPATPSYRLDQDPDSASSAPSSTADEESETGADEPPPESIRPRVRPTHWAIVASLIILASLAILFGPQLATDQQGTLELSTDPAGAQIHLDGEELAGRRTPETLQLEPGNYRLELTLDEFRPRRFRVDIAAGETIILDEDDLRLVPESRPPRTFSVTAEPEEAELLADGEPLGSSPAEVTLEPGEVVNLSAQAADCSPVFYTVSYGHQRKEIHLTLQCTTEDSDPEPEVARRPVVTQHDPSRARRAVRRVLIHSEPPGADILIDDNPIGQAPLYVQLRENESTVIEARRDGFVTGRSVTRARDLQENRIEFALEERPRGCLNFRSVYPANNEIAINGQWLDGRHMALKQHPLPAGTNTITVRHPESGKEEDFVVDVDPGTDCKVLTVWEREQPSNP